MLKSGCVFLLALASASQDWDEAKKKFNDEWGTGNAGRQAAAARALAPHDHAEAAELLFKAAATTERALKDLQQKKIAIQEEMKKYPADKILDSNGNIGKRDWYEKRLELDRKSKEVQQQIVDHEAVLEAIAETVGTYRNSAAVSAAVKEFRRPSAPALRPYLAGAVGRLPGDEATDALALAAADKDVRVAVLAIEALARRGGETPRKAVTDALARDEWQVTQAAAAALITIDSLQAVEPLIAALEKADGRLRDELNRALVALTGENRHGDPAAWRDWWEKNRNDLELTRPPRAARHAALKTAETGEGSTTFYGIPVTSKRVVFVLDRSGSMAAKAKWKPPPDVATGGASNPEPVGDRKIDVCRYELRRAIRMLPEDAHFNVIFYNRDQRALNPDGLIQATKSNKEKSIRFINEVEPTGATNIYDPLEKAFGFGKGDAFKNQVDTVFLLSDGLPNCGQFEAPADIRRELARINAVSRIIVHTVYVGGEKDGEDLMTAIARENKGVFVDRSKPEQK